jgi:vanillate O-demethylase ferredoxin subunit
MHALRPGQDLLISAPKNHFPLNDTARHSILFAGGIGITPILAMAHSLARAGGSFELHYCTRSAQRTAFVDRIRASTFSDRVSFHHDDAPPPSRLDIANTVGAPGVGTHLYVCGPAGFMDTVLGTARTNGWAESALHREYFANEAPAKRGATAFEVQIASTGTVIRVAPEQSVVQALHSAGIALPVSCEQGVCGTCITGVLDGVLEHRDMFLTPEEHARGDRFTPCCSRAKSPRLVLDL